MKPYIHITRRIILLYKKHIRQGDIYYTNLPHNRGSEEAGRRPVLVVSSSRMAWASTVLVVPLTSNMTHRSIPTHVPFQYQFKNGGKQSLALCEHMREIDKKFLDERVGYANRRTMDTIMLIIKEYILREDL